jgi:endoglucanase
VLTSSRDKEVSMRVLLCSLLVCACAAKVHERPQSSGSNPPSDPPPASGPPTGYLHTQGRALVDENGAAVRLTGISWFGLETATYAPHGLWARSLDGLLDDVRALGFNSLRIPFSNQLFDAGSTPNGIDFQQNPDLAGLRGIEILDRVVGGAQARGLRVILDRHRPGADAQSALWYTSRYSEQRWIDDWKMLAARYRGNPTVAGFDLHNEPRDPATWGDGASGTDWRLAAERAGNAILAVNPDLLIIVEGVQTTGGESYWWGGNLRSAAGAPVRLDVAHRLVYSVHDYPQSVYWQPWFAEGNYPANLPPLWDRTWGYLVQNDVAPVWVGEFGTRDQTTSDRQWLTTLADYVRAHDLSFAFWCLNPDSGDTGGILSDDWRTVESAKMDVLRPLLAR